MRLQIFTYIDRYSTPNMLYVICFQARWKRIKVFNHDYFWQMQQKSHFFLHLNAFDVQRVICIYHHPTIKLNNLKFQKVM